jgi:hypothetical protein
MVLSLAVIYALSGPVLHWRTRKQVAAEVNSSLESNQ